MKTKLLKSLLWLCVLVTSVAAQQGDAPPRLQRVESIQSNASPPKRNDQQKTLLQMTVRRSDSTQYLASWGGARLTITGASLIEILSQHCYDISPLRVITNSTFPSGRFDITIETPSQATQTEQADLVGRCLRHAVEWTFGLPTRREMREMNVLVLTVKDPKAVNLRPTFTRSGVSNNRGIGKLKGVNWSMRILTSRLEDLLKKPLIDETKLNDRYDLDLNWEEKDPEHPNAEALISTVREQLGLELTPMKRMVEVLVVDDGSEAK